MVDLLHCSEVGRPSPTLQCITMTLLDDEVTVYSSIRTALLAQLGDGQ